MAHSQFHYPIKSVSHSKSFRLRYRDPVETTLISEVCEGFCDLRFASPVAIYTLLYAVSNVSKDVDCTVWGPRAGV